MSQGKCCQGDEERIYEICAGGRYYAWRLQLDRRDPREQVVCLTCYPHRKCGTSHVERNTVGFPTTLRQPNRHYEAVERNDHYAGRGAEHGNRCEDESFGN